MTKVQNLGAELRRATVADLKTSRITEFMVGIRLEAARQCDTMQSATVSRTPACLLLGSRSRDVSWVGVPQQEKKKGPKVSSFKAHHLVFFKCAKTDATATVRGAWTRGRAHVYAR